MEVENVSEFVPKIRIFGTKQYQISYPAYHCKGLKTLSINLVYILSECLCFIRTL